MRRLWIAATALAALVVSTVGPANAGQAPAGDSTGRQQQKKAAPAGKGGQAQNSAAAAGAKPVQRAPQPARAPAKETFAVRDLLRKTVQLSNIDPKSCLTILGQVGYKTKSPSGKVSLGDLPLVFAMATEIPASIVGGKSSVDQKVLAQNTVSAPENRLMILYHPSQHEEVGELTNFLTDVLDVPARQVLIEGMVLELTEDALRELGAEWQVTGSRQKRITFQSEGESTPFILTYDPELVAQGDLRDRIEATVRAVIDEGKGDVLSSPSVLVLNNRNAKIQVVRDVPIITTLITERTTNLKVEFKTVGIILNIKPRISGDNASVAMQILVEVSEAPAKDFIVIEGQSVAPLINRRVVETVARVQDNTPFIIGGLIRNEKDERVNRVPFLSRIPLLGWLFQVKSTRAEKREVIIVLTPRVIRPTGTNRPVLPKDSDRFDFLENRLFRNSYRLKAEDVFDLRFLRNNPVIQDAFADARGFVQRHPEYASRCPFNELAERIIPGEDAVVVRMIYEIVKQLNAHEKVLTQNLLFFKEQQDGPGDCETGKPDAPVSLPRAADAIEVDGDLADWASVHCLAVPSEEAAVQEAVKLAWRLEGLYGAVRARDEEIKVSADTPWQADSFELLVQKDGLLGSAPTEKTSRYVFSPDPASADGRCHILVPLGTEEESAEGAGIAAAWRKAKGGYTLEFFIPARLLEPAELSHGTVMGLNFRLNDGGRPLVQFIGERAGDEVLRRSDTWGLVRLKRQSTGFRVKFLLEELAETVGGETLEAYRERPRSERTVEKVLAAYFERPAPKKVLFLHFRLPVRAGLGQALQDPVATVEWKEVRDKDEIEDHLFAMNSVGKDARFEEYALVINTRKDLDRLKAAIALREVTRVNNFEDVLHLRNFQVGRKIVMPELTGKDERMFLIDEQAAEFFFKSDYYYDALKARMERSYQILDEALASEGER